MPSDSDYASQVNIVRGTPAELILFLVLNMWPSHLGLPLLLMVVIFSKRVHRHPTFVNLCIIFVLIGISSSLLVYSGNTSGPEPSQILCLLQASLLYGVPVMASTAVFTLVLQMFLVIRATFNGVDLSNHRNTIRLWLMIIAPYFLWFAGILATATVGAAHPERISRSRRFFYCSVDFDPLSNTITTVAAVVLLGTLILEVWTLVLFYRLWISVKNGGISRPTMEVNLPARVLAFAIYVMASLSLSLLSIKSPASPLPDLVIAFAATAVVLIFGTQPDIFRAFCFWRKAIPILAAPEKVYSINLAPDPQPQPLRWSHRAIPRF